MVRVELRYGRGSFIMITALLVLMSLILVVFLSSFSAGRDILIPAGALAFATVVIYGIVPMYTYHYIEEGMLVLRQGLFFKGEIKLSNITAVERIERGPWRTGVFFNLRGAVLYVTTRRSDLVLLKLSEKQRFGSIFGKRVDTIIFDCLETERAVKALSDALTPSNRSR